MSLINKMLQDLDKRHAADGSGKTLTQQLRPVQVRKNWKRIMWEVGAGLIVGAGWTAWVLYQMSPRPVVTDLALRLQARAPQPAGAAPVPAVPVVPAPAPAQETTPQPAPAVAPAESATKVAEAANLDMFKLATEIGTPFNEKRFAARPKEVDKRTAGTAPAKPAKEQEQPAMASRVAPASKAPASASIDKRVRLLTPAERAEDAFRNASGLLNQGRVAEAIEGYKSTLQQDAGHAPARQALVGLLLENRRIGEAQQYLQEGLSLHPERPTYAILLARIQVERGDLQGAHELLSKHAGSAAGDADYHAFDAALLQRLGRHKEAISGYQAALKLAPKDSPNAGVWLMGMGISLQADNRGAEALDAFQRAKSAGGLSPTLLAFVDQRMKQLR